MCAAREDQMKKALLLVVLIFTIGGMVGCGSSKSFDGFNRGSGGSGSSGTIQAGNWAFHATGGINGDIYMGGYLSGSSSSFGGKMQVSGTSATGFTLAKGITPMTISGSVSNGTLTMTGTAGSSTFTISFPNISSSGSTTTLDGTYSVVGGSDTGDAGSVGGLIVPDGAYTGTWAGVSSISGGTMTFNFTEGTTPNTDGTFPLTATTAPGVAFSAVTGCVVTGTLVSQFSYAAGPLVVLDATTVDNGVAGEVRFVGLTNSYVTPSQLAGAGYIYNGGSACFLDNSGSQVSFGLLKP
jgi:hypothetical protein